MTWSDETVKAMLIALTMVGGAANAARGEDRREEREMEARQDDRSVASGDAVAGRSNPSPLTHPPGSG